MQVNSNNYKILYIFGSGRRNKIQKNSFDSSEFFYGYFYIKKKYKNTNYIEMLPEGEKLNTFQKLLNIIDKVLRKFSNLPFFIHLITTRNNFEHIKDSNKIIATNDRLGISSLPMFIYAKYKDQNKRLIFIVMGLFSKKYGNKFIYAIQNFFLKYIIKNVNTLIFLGKGEYELAKLRYPRFESKFKFVPFGINLNFWNPSKKYNPNSNDYILFIGNDGNRDFNKLIDISNNLSNIKIKIVTNQNISQKIKNNNTEVIYGDWNSSALTDLELKNLYENAVLTFLPLKETFQPSGQSVTLQSMSLGVPVMITKTKGFWDLENFKHKENIYFVESNNTEDWSKNIYSVISNSELLENLSRNSIDTVNRLYNQEMFFEKLENLIK